LRKAFPEGGKMAKGKILLIDDDLGILEILERRLASKEFEVTTASTGEAALKKIQKMRPDLIILDLILPGMNGYKICGWLKKNRKYRDIPIVMLTVKDQTEDKLLGIEAGADAYVTKPYITDELLREVERQLFLARRRSTEKE
jgi:DNA-binding response OmpR family regulator